MTDTSGTPMSPARDSRLTPEAVAERGFTQVKRGYAESEVRAFLRMVADDLGAMRNRERELIGRLQDLEQRLARPAQPPSDQDLIAALGEETARVLGQAREAAVELRAKADEHARHVVREAQESARELRASTQQSVELQTREAEDAARARARDIVAEARALRERILTDLNERRSDLERQINDLRAGRGRLVEVYELVERALVQATRTMAEEPLMPTPTVPESSDTAPEAAPDAATPNVVDGDDAEPPRAEPPRAEPQSAHTRSTEPQSAQTQVDAPDVGALFQKLRSEAGATDEPHEAVGATDETRETGEIDAGPVAELVAEVVEVPDAPDASDAVEAEADEPGSQIDAALVARDEALAPVAESLAHRAKRALQDEQNDVLDGIRRQRGTIDVGKVLPSSEDQLSRWAHVLQPAVDTAYAAGAASLVGGSQAAAAGAAPSSLLTELANAVSAPLRTRVESSLESIDARSPADAEIAIAQRLGARYREWRGQDLEQVLGDALAAAFARGAYDAAPPGARLRWVAARVGKCPDCDDNALEPTARGDKFPTGQSYPPAHPGCRCLLVLVT